MYHLIRSLYLRATSLPEYSILLLGLDAAGKTTLHNQIKLLFNDSSSSSSTSWSTTTTTATPPDPGKTVPTVGQNVSTVALPDMYLRIWDVGGQHALRGLWQSYYAECHAIVFVVDSTDIGDADISRLPAGAAGAMTGANGVRVNGEDLSAPSPIYPRSFASALDDDSYGRLNEARLVLESVLQHADAAGVPLLVLANKQDREDSVEVVRIKEGFVRKVFEGEKGANVRDSRVLPCSALTGTGVKEAVEWLCSRVKWNHEARPPVMR